MAFIEHSLAGDPTNWWAPNHACVEAMLRSAGLEPRERPGHEIVVAHRTGPPRMPDELRAILAPDGWPAGLGLPSVDRKLVARQDSGS